MVKSFRQVPSIVIFASGFLWVSLGIKICQAFSLREPSIASSTIESSSSSTPKNNNNNNNNILILDHININHQLGRHDWLHAFYGTFLGCAWDPRKKSNVEKGSGTVWANIGAHQFHLPEGKTEAQVLDGMVTLVYPTLKPFNVDGERYKQAQQALSGSQFSVDHNVGSGQDEQHGGDNLLVTDPWGTQIQLVEGDSSTDRDPRGKQPGEVSEGLGMKELTIHVPQDANLEGIGRWYESVLGGIVVSLVTNQSKEVDNNQDGRPHVRIAMGPYQSLTFVPHPETTIDSHVDLRVEPISEKTSSDDAKETKDCPSPSSLGNYGPHISLYVADLSATYQRAADVGSVYVNTRFSRQAFSLEQAIEQCMFRSLDIVDPLHPEDGIIIRLEHEVRSVVNPDGSMYKSCPFNDIPNSM